MPVRYPRQAGYALRLALSLAPEAPTHEQVGEAARARIEAGHSASFGGCNRYMDPIRESAQGEVAIGPLAGTGMVCPESGMALEQGFLSVLGKVSRYVYVAGRLRL